MADPGREPWLAAFRRACDRIADAARALSPERRRAPQGRGAGGDVTALIDRVAEDIVLDELRALGRPLEVVSEEVGRTSIGGGGGALVVVDPIDGSVNAMRGLPVFSTSLALAGGPTMDDVSLGLVRDHGTGDEWVAVRGDGARLNGVRLNAAGREAGSELDVVMVEGAYPERLVALGALAGRAGRVRAFGSLALSLCHTAAGRADGMVALAPGRSVDVAAAQLIATEAGLVVGLPGAADLAATPLDLEARFLVTAARDRASLDLLERVAASA